MANNSGDYKQRLANHLAKAKLMPPPKEIVAGTPSYTTAQIKALLAPLSEADRAKFKLAVKDNKEFTDLTGTSHSDMITNWIAGGKGDGRLTACNAFCGYCSTVMGCPVPFNRFNIETHLASLGLSQAWVPGNSGKKPGYGDIYEHSDKVHAGVSLGFEGEDWITVAAGEGGPTYQGVDKVQSSRRKFDPTVLKGWISMAKLLGPRFPDWLEGWWTIFQGDKTWNYHFDESFVATCSPFKPLSPGQPPMAHADSGSFAIENYDDVVITWKGEGGIERFKYDRYESVPALMEKMNGVDAAGATLKGVRI